MRWRSGAGWNWNTDPGHFTGDDCLTPQLKPAEDVLRKYYPRHHAQAAGAGRARALHGRGKVHLLGIVRVVEIACAAFTPIAWAQRPEPGARRRHAPHGCRN